MKFSQPIQNRLLSYLLSLLLGFGFVGCRTREVVRDFPTRSLVSFSASGQTDMPDRWWLAFEDQALDYHVNQALGDNFELAVALQRLRAARALSRREASDLFPDVDGIFGTNTTFGPGPNQTAITWGLDASYQVDLWGEIQSRVEAEKFRAEATQADYHAVALTLAAEVAQTWFALIEAHAQLELLDKQVKTNREGLTMQGDRFRSGLSRLSNVYRQEQLVEATLEQAVVVRARIELLEHQLAVLQGELPQAAGYDVRPELPDLPPLPYAGLPSELLSRRPDVRRDYLAFVAADRDLASAVSAQYPRLNITGSVVNAAQNSEDLFRDWFVSIGSQLIAPLLDGGQRRAEVDRTDAVTRQRFNEYGQTMLVAFREVEDNLASERYQVQRLERLNRQAELAQEALQLLLIEFATGGDNYLDVLSATQAEQRLQREILSARLDLVRIRIGLYLALAGDFDPCPQPTVELPLERPPEQPLQQPVEEGTETDQSDAEPSVTPRSNSQPPNQPDLPLDPPLPATPLERLPPV